MNLPALALTLIVFAASIAIGAVVTRRFQPLPNVDDDYRLVAKGPCTHAVPDDGYEHSLDPSASCLCGTWAGNHVRDDGSTGWLIEHRRMAGQ